MGVQGSPALGRAPVKGLVCRGTMRRAGHRCGARGDGGAEGAEEWWNRWGGAGWGGAGRVTGF